MIQPFPYQQAVVAHLKDKNELWTWVKSNQFDVDEFDAWKSKLLTDSYRLEQLSHASIYQSAEEILAYFELPHQVTLYQALDQPNSNAYTRFNESEIHIVFCGSILTQLNPTELQALLAHEIGHLYLQSLADYDYHTASHLLNALATDTATTNCYDSTLKIYNFYTELFCDCCAYDYLKSIEVVVSTLVKTSTGMQQVDPQSYIAQSAEIFEKGLATTQGNSHPEHFIRTHALSMIHQRRSDSETLISQMLQPMLNIDDMDIFQQNQLREVTLSMVQSIQTHELMKTESVHHLAKQYELVAPQNLPKAKQKQTNFSNKTKDYFAWVLTDFTLAEPENVNEVLPIMTKVAEQYEVTYQYQGTLQKALKLNQRSFKSLLKKADVKFVPNND